MSVQVFVNGIQDDLQIATDMTFSTNPADVFGCTDSDATNFDATAGATIDDGSCIFPCAVALDSASVVITPPTCAGENSEPFKLKRLVHKERTTITSIARWRRQPWKLRSLVAGTYEVIVLTPRTWRHLVGDRPGVDPVTMTAELTIAACHNADGVITITEVLQGWQLHVWYFKQPH